MTGNWARAGRVCAAIGWKLKATREGDCWWIEMDEWKDEDDDVEEEKKLFQS